MAPPYCDQTRWDFHKCKGNKCPCRKPERCALYMRILFVVISVGLIVLSFYFGG